jgi:hypothetical protein
VFTYSATCDVPEETLLQVTALLRAYRREIGTRKRRRSGTERTQAKLVLRWMTPQSGCSRWRPGCRYPPPTGACTRAIDVIAEQAPVTLISAWRSVPWSLALIL